MTLDEAVAARRRHLHTAAVFDELLHHLNKAAEDDDFGIPVQGEEEVDIEIVSEVMDELRDMRDEARRQAERISGLEVSDGGREDRAARTRIPRIGGGSAGRR